MSEAEWEAASEEAARMFADLDRQQEAAFDHDTDDRTVPRTPSELEIGRMWAKTFANDRTWTNREGVTVELERMDRAHRTNTMGWLRRHVTRLRFAVETYEIHSLPSQMGEMAEELVTTSMERGWDRSDLEWLYEQPLFIRLVALDQAAAAEDQLRRTQGHLDSL